MRKPEIRELEGQTVVDYGSVWFVVESTGRIMARETLKEPGEKYSKVVKRYPSLSEQREVRRVLKLHAKASTSGGPR